MKKAFVRMAAMVIVVSVALPAFALPPVYPVLPPVENIDTEIVSILMR